MGWNAPAATLTVMAIQILHRDAHLLAVVKPPNLSTTSPPGGDSLEFRLRNQLPTFAAYLHACHRLDACVGGIVLMAVTRRGARLVADQFASRKVAKTYDAIVHGRVEATSPATWRDFIRKRCNEARAEIVHGDVVGSKEAITVVDVVASSDVEATGPRTRLRLHPHTGRMHQLRLQASSRGHPILGDTLYGDSHKKTAPTSIALWASEIEFHDVVSGKRMHLVAPIDWDDSIVKPGT